MHCSVKTLSGKCNIIQIKNRQERIMHVFSSFFPKGSSCCYSTCLNGGMCQSKVCTCACTKEFTSKNCLCPSSRLYSPLAIYTLTDSKWQNNHFPKEFFCKKACHLARVFKLLCATFYVPSLILLKTIKLLALNSGFALINYHLTEISSS